MPMTNYTNLPNLPRIFTLLGSASVFHYGVDPQPKDRETESSLSFQNAKYFRLTLTALHYLYAFETISTPIATFWVHDPTRGVSSWDWMNSQGCGPWFRGPHHRRDQGVPLK